MGGCSPDHLVLGLLKVHASLLVGFAGWRYGAAVVVMAFDERGQANFAECAGSAGIGTLRLLPQRPHRAHHAGVLGQSNVL